MKIMKDRKKKDLENTLFILQLELQSSLQMGKIMKKIMTTKFLKLRSLRPPLSHELPPLEW